MSDAHTPDSILKKLDTPEECEQFAINVQDKHPEVAMRAKRRAVELRAQGHGAKTEIECEALEVVYAYEAVLSERNGKKTRATRTWQMIDRHGILPAVERAVDREMDTLGYKALVKMGMKDLTFESLVLKHPTAFTAETGARCKERLEEAES